MNRRLAAEHDGILEDVPTASPLERLYTWQWWISAPLVGVSVLLGSMVRPAAWIAGLLLFILVWIPVAFVWARAGQSFSGWCERRLIGYVAQPFRQRRAAHTALDYAVLDKDRPVCRLKPDSKAPPVDACGGCRNQSGADRHSDSLTPESAAKERSD